MIELLYECLGKGFSNLFRFNFYRFSESYQTGRKFYYLYSLCTRLCHSFSGLVVQAFLGTAKTFVSNGLITFLPFDADFHHFGKPISIVFEINNKIV